MLKIGIEIEVGRIQRLIRGKLIIFFSKMRFLMNRSVNKSIILNSSVSITNLIKQQIIENNPRK